MKKPVFIIGVNLRVSFAAVDGRHIEQDFEPWLEGSRDLDEDMDQAAAKIAWAGAMLGLMYEADEVLDARYRQWRADEGERMLARSEKLSEFKVKQLIESSAEFVRLKSQLAELHRGIHTLESAVRALSAQSDMLRSRGANRRAELRATGMSTSEEDPERRPDDRDRRVRDVYHNRRSREL